MSTAEELHEPGRLKRPVAHDALTRVEERPNQSGTYRTPGPNLLRLAWPIAAAMLGDTAMGLVDTKLVSGLGPAAIGGVGVGSTVMYLAYACVFGLMRGVKVRTSHAVGEGRPHDGFAFARAGVLVGGLIGLATLVACRDVSSLLRLVGTNEALVAPARDFLAAVTLGAPFLLATTALVQHRQASGDSRTPMTVTLVGNVLNALLAWSLVYGRLGLPALGVAGAGLATSFVEVLEFLVLGALFLRDARGTPSTLAFRPAVRDVLTLGIPTGAQFGAETLAFATFTAIISGIAAAEIAANQIAIAVLRVSFLPGIAVAEAGSVLIGHALGRRDLEEADAVVKKALRTAVGFMTTCGLLFAVMGGAVARFFTDDPEVLAITRRLLLIAAVFQVLDAGNIVLRASLRGAKDVRAVALIGALVIWTCVPTSALVFGKWLGLGALGGWIGFLLETGLGALVFYRRWSRGSWRAAYR